MIRSSLRVYLYNRQDYRVTFLERKKCLFFFEASIEKANDPKEKFLLSSQVSYFFAHRPRVCTVVLWK